MRGNDHPHENYAPQLRFPMLARIGRVFIQESEMGTRPLSRECYW